MSSKSLTKPIPMIMITTMIFMGLNASIPLYSSPLKAEVTQDPFKLTMTLPKDTFNLGEPVNITIRLEYIGNETITLIFSDGTDRTSFNVYNAIGSLVYDEYSQTVYAGIYIPTKVEPGDVGGATHTWYQDDGLIYRGIGKDPPAYYKKVPSGIYRIVGMFISHTLDLTIETPPVTIRIL